MEDLRRELAPISSTAWEAIDSEAKRVLKVNLAARKLVDFEGPLGWKESSVDLGRVDALRNAPAEGVTAALRRVQPLVELRAFFELSRRELDDLGRGAKDPNLDPLIEAAKRIARAEDLAVFYGYGAAQIRGICESSPHATRRIPGSYAELPRVVAETINMLREAGVDGPYAIAVNPRIYAGLMQATEGGYPVLKLVANLVEDRVIWAPAVDGAVVISMRGGDYLLTVGQDLSIGYSSHSGTAVELYLLESFTFQVLAAEAAVAMSDGASSTKAKKSR